MLKESFVVLPGVKHRTEFKLWQQGINSWDDFLGVQTIKGLGRTRKDSFDCRLKETMHHLKIGNSSFFKKMPDQWRLYDEFKDDAVFLDIETDGFYSGITVIGLSDGFDTKTFVRGFNLERSLLIKELSKYKLIITFNGASFDLPVINRFFQFTPHIPHIDLRFVCQKLGFTGGLKAIEEKLSISRRPEVKGLSGQDAVYLWEMWKSTGDRDYLDKLVWYNEEDILNLKPLAEKMIPAMWSKVRYLKNAIAFPTVSPTANGSFPVRT